LNYEKQFFEKLTVLAKVCSFDLDTMIFRAYDSYLAPYGYEKICQALEKIFTTRRTRDPFPSIKEILDQILPPTDFESEAREAAGRILQAVNRFGWVNPTEACKFIGELGWRAVERYGGWNSLCHTMTVQNTPIIQAQLRDIALASLKRAAAGLDNQAPLLNARDRNLLSETKKLIDGSDDENTGHAKSRDHLELL